MLILIISYVLTFQANLHAQPQAATAFNVEAPTRHNPEFGFQVLILNDDQPRVAMYLTDDPPTKLVAIERAILTTESLDLFLYETGRRLHV